jgi:hypothetical protein
MNYAPGCGDYVQETTWRYVGYGGDYCEEKPRDFTCIFACGGLFSVCILVVLLIVLLWPTTTTRIECRRDEMWKWDQFERARCCRLYPEWCATTTQINPPAPTPPVTTPPTPAPPPPGPVDPNCAIGWCNWMIEWTPAKKAWCCANHHRGCAGDSPRPCDTVRPTPGCTTQGPPPDPYNCAVDWCNWQMTWTEPKKTWCCAHHKRGCPGDSPHPCGGGGCTTSKPYDCAAGFSNWQAGWSIAKKAWCCAHEQKGCGGGGGCM